VKRSNSLPIELILLLILTLGAYLVRLPGLRLETLHVRDDATGALLESWTGTETDVAALAPLAADGSTIIASRLARKFVRAVDAPVGLHMARAMALTVALLLTAIIFSLFEFSRPCRTASTGTPLP
jgi:hypothetical protein